MPLDQNEKVERYNQIMLQSARLFKERGFTLSSMRDLASEMGMEAPSLYYHIGSKDEILEQICFFVANSYLDYMDELERGYGQLTYTEKLKSIIRFHVEMTVKHSDYVSVTNHDWKCLRTEKLEAFRALRNQYESKVEDIIRGGIEEGKLAKVEPSIALYTMFGALRWIEHWWKPERGMTVRALQNTMLTLIINGLKK